MEHVVLQIVMRYLHLTSVIVAVGGWAFLLICLRPATRMVETSLRDTVTNLTQQKFARVLWFAIGGLIVSGIYNWVLLAKEYKQVGAIGNALIGTKVLLAVVMFAIIWLRAIGLIKGRERMFLSINIHLAALIVLLAAILRYYRLTHGAG